MIPGFNDSVRLGEQVFHIQTEDLGAVKALVVSQIFLEGRILHTQRSEYRDKLELPTLDREVKKLLLRQHRDMHRLVQAGELQARLDPTARRVTTATVAEPLAAAPAEVGALAAGDAVGADPPAVAPAEVGAALPAADAEAVAALPAADAEVKDSPASPTGSDEAPSAGWVPADLPAPPGTGAKDGPHPAEPADESLMSAAPPALEADPVAAPPAADADVDAAPPAGPGPVDLPAPVAAAALEALVSPEETDDPLRWNVGVLIGLPPEQGFLADLISDRRFDLLVVQEWARMAAAGEL